MSLKLYGAVGVKVDMETDAPAEVFDREPPPFDLRHTVVPALVFGSLMFSVYLAAFVLIQSMRHFVYLAPELVQSALVLALVAAGGSLVSRVLVRWPIASYTVTGFLAVSLMWFVYLFILPKFEDLWISSVDCYQRIGRLW